MAGAEAEAGGHVDIGVTAKSIEVSGESVERWWCRLCSSTGVADDWGASWLAGKAEVESG